MTENVSLPNENSQAVEERLLLTPEVEAVISKNLKTLMPVIKMMSKAKVTKGTQLQKIVCGDAEIWINENGKDIKCLIKGEQISELLKPIFYMITGG